MEGGRDGVEVDIWWTTVDSIHASSENSTCKGTERDRACRTGQGDVLKQFAVPRARDWR